MERKEVVVAGRVFSLGLKELDNTLSEGEGNGRSMTLEVGPTVFQAGVLRQERAFCLHWTGMTNVRNIVWQRFVIVWFQWPPVKALSCFTNLEEDIYS